MSEGVFVHLFVESISHDAMLCNAMHDPCPYSIANSGRGALPTRATGLGLMPCVSECVREGERPNCLLLKPAAIIDVGRRI